MSTEFYEDLDTLCQTPVVDFSHAQQVLDVLAEVISDELEQLDEEYRGICCGKFVNSMAYKYNLEASHTQLVDWLTGTDKLHTQRLLLVGSLVLQDLPSLISYLHDSQAAISAVTEAIWIYRFTEPAVVATFLLVLYGILVRGQLEEEVLDSSFNVEFLHYLYRSACDGEMPREPLIVLMALNDQYMLHDKRDNDNLVFAALESKSLQYCSIGSAIVLTLNRCGHDDQDLKIFICKFLYLIFMTPATADLLYTNDLTVFAEIMIRELNDLPLESVEVRAMYLRVLYAMLAHSSIEYSGPQLRGSLVQVLRLTIESAENLEGGDRDVIVRLAERCLGVPWLQWRLASEEPEPEESGDHKPVAFNPDQEFELVEGLEFGTAAQPTMPGQTASFSYSYCQQPSSSGSSTRSGRPPLPPPPPPVPRHHSIASIASSDSRLSYDTVVHFRPPPPIPRKR